jgi:hypothetical protein
LSMRVVDKSIQNHGGANQIFHGHTDTNTTERLFETYLSDLAKDIAAKYLQNNHVLMVAAVREQVDIINNALPNKQVAPFHLVGSFEDASPSVLQDKIMSELESSKATLVKESLDDMSLSESNRLEKATFADLVIEIQKGRVDKLYVGRLETTVSEDLSTNTPLNANSLAIEVFKLGGKVIYFPEYDFEFTNTELVFKFRY